MDNIFYQLALVLILASALGVIVFRLKLPLVVAYLVAGLLLSLLRIFDLGHSPVFEVLPEIGIAFVLFLIGMELKLNELKVLGKPIFTAAVGQILLTTLLGFGLARLLGFDNSAGFYLGVGLAFSSTVVVIKMLSENRDLSSLYGKLSIGMLLVEDLVAIIILMLISVGSSAFDMGLQSSFPILMLVLKAVGLFLLTFVLSKFVLNKAFEFTARSVELLYITAMAWCFAFTSLAVAAGFSIEIGAFLAGVALASSPYHLQIQAKIKPMRDFFIALFFIYLGSTAQFTDLAKSLPIIILFTLYALAVKPLIYAFLLSRFGFKKHTIFQTALYLSQISEFSLIVLMVGVNSNLVDPIAISIMAAVAVLSITISSITISYNKVLYKLTGPLMGKMEKKGRNHYFEHNKKNTLTDHIIVIGAHRVGSPIIKYLQSHDIPFVAMDFNPSIVRELVDQGAEAVYGDIGDPDIIEELHIETAKLIICTASDFSDNQLLLNIIKEKNDKAKVVLRAVDTEHAKILKELGADYVLLPEKVSGDYIVHQIKHYWPDVNFKDGISFGNKAVSSIL
jgi:Kef-type K+ transport system membrane component KefB